MQRWQHNQIKNIQDDVQSDVADLNRCKLEWLMEIAQIGHRDGDESIDGYGDKHYPDVLRMVGIAHGCRDGVDETADDGSEDERRGAHHTQRRGVDAVGIFTLLAHEAEEGGLHAVGQQDDEQRNIGIDVGDDTVLTARGTEALGLDRHQKIVDETGNNARKPIDGCVFDE